MSKNERHSSNVEDTHSLINVLKVQSQVLSKHRPIDCDHVGLHQSKDISSTSLVLRLKSTAVHLEVMGGKEIG